MKHPDTLTKSDVHVWLAEPDTLLASLETIDEALDLLDADERHRYRAFRFDRDRRVFLAAHLLLRTSLSRYAPVPPGDWAFEKNAFGRPEIAGPPEADALRFSLSHTDGLVACAVTKQSDIGVDVEMTSRRTPVLELAERFFAPEEHRMLREAPADQHNDMFLAVWTLKEAYIKARGMGLSLGLDRFAFVVSGGGGADVRFHDDLNDDPGLWQFHVTKVQPDHTLALAVHREAGADKTFVFQPTVRSCRRV